MSRMQAIHEQCERSAGLSRPSGTARLRALRSTHRGAHMRSPSIAALTAALTLGAVLSGCSSGSGSSSSIAQSPAARPLPPGPTRPLPCPACPWPPPHPPRRTRRCSRYLCRRCGLPSGCGEGRRPPPPRSVKADSAMSGVSASTSASTSHATSDLGIPDTALAGRSISYTAEETVKVDDVGKAVSSIEGSVAAAGGLVANSQRSGSGDDATRSEHGAEGPAGQFPARHWTGSGSSVRSSTGPCRATT